MLNIRPLDTYTLDFALIVLFIFSSSIVVILSSLFKRRALQWTSVGLSLCGIGYLVAQAGPDLNGLVRLLLSQLLISTGFGLMGYGVVMDISGLRPAPDKGSIQNRFGPVYIAGALAIGTALSSIFLYVWPSMSNYVIAVSCINAVLHGYLGLKILSLNKSTLTGAIRSLAFCHLGFVFTALYTMSSAVRTVPDTLEGIEPALRIHLLYSLVALCVYTGLILMYVISAYQSKTKSHVDKLQQLTFTDPLTGVHNKRSVMRIIAAEKERISRYESKCCLAIIDLDHFKKVNDTYGHLYGDHVLKTFSKISTDQLRTFDTVARYGGEEFLLVLPETDLYQGMLIADRLRKAVSDFVWDKSAFRQTICVGVVEINKSNCSNDIRHLISAADEALYVAKKNGRNHVEAAPSQAHL